MNRREIRAVVPVIVVIGLWELCCRAGLVSPVLLSSPSEIIKAGAGLAASGGIGQDLRSTLGAFASCLTLAALLGTLAGAAMGYSPSVYSIVNPFFVSMNSIPKIALMPVLVLWLGIGTAPKIFLGTLMGSFPIAVSVLAGMRAVEREYVLLARSFGAGPMRILRSVILPGLVPYTLAGLRVAVNYVLVGILTAEFFAADQGIGFKMVLFSSNFEVASYFALLVFIALLAILSTAAIQAVEQRLASRRAEPFA